MKLKCLLVFIISIALCKKPNNLRSEYTFITFSDPDIVVVGDGVEISESTLTITKPGAYLAQGSIKEANILIKSNSVDLLLQNIDLTSTKTAPIEIASNLKDVKIINVQNTTLNDLENPSTTKGECAVIKIKKDTKIYLENQGFFKMNGTCKNIIKGGDNVSIIFDSSGGEYIINANATAIATDGYLEFNKGTYTIKAGADAIKCSPDETDNKNIGKILIKDGNFNIECLEDAFTATNNITIVNGIFNIKTEKGYDSKTFDKDESSAKGFKLTNNVTGCEIKIYGGEFYINSADDSFHSKGDLTVYSGNYTIYSGDDGLHAGLNLVLGIKNASLDDLDLKIFNSYEALEGMTITIYSGKFILTAEDDGINGAGGNGGDEPGPGPGPGPGPRPDPPGPWPPENDSDSDWPWPPRNDSDDDWPPGPPPGGRGNASYYISIYGGQINVFCDGDGLDTNGNIFIHGGELNVFSQGNRDNEPIDHDGNFTLFNAEVLGVGSQGIEKIHDGIEKGNEMYAYYASAITKNKILKIRDENNNVVKQGNITKDINYIFYSSLELNENFTFYIYDENNKETQLNVKFGKPPEGEDDEDRHDKKNHQKNLKISILGLFLILTFL